MLASTSLANLVDSVREDFPNIPLSVVAHSQRNMTTLCAMHYVKSRARDTLVLNGAPYSLGANITNSSSMACGWSGMQVLARG